MTFVLQALANLGLLIPRGERRGRFYTAGERLIEIRNAITRDRPARDEQDPFGDATGR